MRSPEWTEVKRYSEFPRLSSFQRWATVPESVTNAIAAAEVLDGTASTLPVALEPMVYTPDWKYGSPRTQPESVLGYQRSIQGMDTAPLEIEKGSITVREEAKSLIDQRSPMKTKSVPLSPGMGKAQPTCDS